MGARKLALSPLALGAVGVGAALLMWGAWRSASGLVLGVGDLFDVPRTDAEKCAAARADGRLWDATLYCPASDLGGVGNAAGGIVMGAGEAVGVPQTSLSECERAKAEGRTWDASFACPAGHFLKYLWS